MMYINIFIILYLSIGLIDNVSTLHTKAPHRRNTVKEKEITKRNYVQVDLDPFVSKVSLIVTKVDLVDEHVRLKYNNGSYDYMLTLTLLSHRDYRNAYVTHNTKFVPFSRPITFGFSQNFLRTMKNLRFHLSIDIFNEKNSNAEETCDENVLSEIKIPQENTDKEFARLLCRNKFLVSYKFNYTCVTRSLDANQTCEGGVTSFKYDTNHYECVHGKFCQSLTNISDNFTCFQPLPTTPRITTTTRTTTTSSTRRTSATKITSTSTRPPSSSTAKDTDLELEKDFDNLSSTVQPTFNGHIMFWDRVYCIPMSGAVALLAALIILAFLNICCLILMKKNHGSYHDLFCGPQSKTKKEQQQNNYHMNDELYSKPWDDKENTTLDHLFVSMPDIRENIRKSDHIYAVPQLPQNLNNIVQYRKLPSEPGADSQIEIFPASAEDDDEHRSPLYKEVI